jgi:hypothetical protein
MTDIKHEVDERKLPSTYELLSTLKSIFTQWLIHGDSRLILVYPAAQASRKWSQVWMHTKQHEMLESKRPRKSPDAITVYWPREKLVVLTQTATLRRRCSVILPKARIDNCLIFTKRSAWQGQIKLSSIVFPGVYPALPLKAKITLHSG